MYNKFDENITIWALKIIQYYINYYMLSIIGNDVNTRFIR